MNKKIKYNGTTYVVDFNIKINSKWEADVFKNNCINSIVGYDFIINNHIFKVVSIATGYIKNGGFYAGTIHNSITYSVPGHLNKDYPDNHKKIIEAIINKYPQIINQ